MSPRAAMWRCHRATVSALVLSLAVASLAGAQERTLTVADVTRLRAVGSVQISPDGERVAYTVVVPRDLAREDDGPAWVELHVVDGDGSRPFIRGPVNVADMAWVGAGAEISYLARRARAGSGKKGADDHGEGGGDKEVLYAIPIAGGESRQLLELETSIEEYAWDPAGERVAAIARAPLPERRQELIEKGFDREVFEEEVAWPQLWIAAPGGAEEPRLVELPGIPSQPRWSPDGTHIALALAPTPHIDDRYMRRRVAVIDVASGEVVGRLENPGKLGTIRWSPDGERIALVAATSLHDPSPGHVLIGPAAGGELVDVAPRLTGHIVAVEWLDDSSLLYLMEEGTASRFGRITIGQRFIVKFAPSVRPVATAFSISADRQSVAFAGHAATHPAEVFLYGHKRQETRRLTDSNPWLSEVRFARQEVVEYKARDGLDIQGVLMHPLERGENEQVPLIVVVHGGPESHYSNGWLTGFALPGQVAAARGFAVFHPNYRGSTGRGVAFSQADHADFGGKEFLDLVDGVTVLSERGLVDSARVGVTGASYGGYASAWCATALSEHFAAAVMSVGISNQLSFAGTTEIPDEMTLVHYRKRPWEDWALFLERSPIRHVERARTPLLILHGKDDSRVHPSQSLELYRHLEVLGEVPVRLILYPGEGHGNRRAASRLDYQLRLMRWMEHYLVGEGGEPPAAEIDPAEFLAP